MGPELFAGLPHPPAFFDVAALASSDLQLARRLPCREVLLRVEDGEMLPDDLFRPVPLDAFGAGVPGGDHPLGREHEDGVVGDAVDQLPEALLVGVQPGRPPRGGPGRLSGEHLDGLLEGLDYLHGLVDRMAAEAARLDAKSPARGHGAEQVRR